MTEISKPVQTNQTASSSLQAGAYKTLTIDYELYHQYLEDSDLTEVQKREFLDTLWNVIVNFVDLGFGVHPLQQVIKSSHIVPACEQATIPAEYLTPDSANMVDLNTIPKTNFKQASDGMRSRCSQISEKPAKEKP